MSMQPLVDEFIGYLNFERGLAKNTQLAYRADLTRFTDWVRSHGIAQLNDVRSEDITDYLFAQRKAGLSASSLSQHLAAIKIFFRYLSQEKYLANNVTDNLDSPKLWRLLPNAFCSRSGHPIGRAQSTQASRYARSSTARIALRNRSTRFRSSQCAG